MRTLLRSVNLATLALIGWAAPAAAIPIADFQDDFQSGTPKPGWTYQWNDNAAIGNRAEYAPLQGAPDGSYQANGDAAYPDAAPASFTILRRDLAAPPTLPQTTLRPGQGSAQAADGIERYVILGYTVSAADIAAAGGNQLVLDNYVFAVGATSIDGVTARVYKNDQLFVNQDLPPGIIFSSDLPDPNGGPIPLGPFNAGDTLYVAIGADGIAPEPPTGVGGTDTNDNFNVDFTIRLEVPEPTTAAVFALAGAGVLLRRRSRPRRV